MTAASALPTVTLHGGSSTMPTLLGQAPARIPTAGKIRAGIKVLTERAAGEPRGREIYEHGLRDGHSFDRIEQALAEALPQLKDPHSIDKRPPVQGKHRRLRARLGRGQHQQRTAAAVTCQRRCLPSFAAFAWLSGFA